MIFAIPAAEIISKNPEYFDGSIVNSSAPLIAASLVYALIGGLLLLPRNVPGLRLLFFAYLLTAPAWYLLKISKTAFPADTIPAILVGLCLVVAVIFLRRADVARVRDLTLVFGGVIIVGKVLLIISADDRVRADTTVTRASPAPINATLPNIYHIVLDEFQSDLFTLSLDDTVKAALSGFTFYPDAITPFGRTGASIAATLSGTEYRYEQPLPSYIEGSFTERSVVNRLRDHGYRTGGVLWTPFRRFNFIGQFDSIYWQKNTSPRDIPDGHPRLLMSLWVYRSVPSDVAALFIPPHHFKQLEAGTLLPGDAPIKSLISFRKFIEREAGKPAHGRYEFVHLMLPHFPEVLGADCEYAFGKLTTPEDQARCAIQAIREFIARLKELGRFEDSLILIHADHGKWMHYDGGELVASEKGITDLEWNWGRSRPLVLFKPAGVAGGVAPLIISRRPIGLLDLAPTILESLGLSVGDKLAGQSLLKPDSRQGSTRYYHMYRQDLENVINGDLMRYTVTDGKITFDSAIPLPALGK